MELQAVLAALCAILAAIGGYMIGRNRKGVEMPLPPDIPEHQNKAKVIKHEQSEGEVAATVEAARRHDVDPRVVDDGLEWLQRHDL